MCLMLVGLAPAIKLSRVDIGELLTSGAGTGKSRSARQRYGVLVVTEVALALALLASASLLMKAAVTVHAFDYSFDFKGLVTTSLRVSRTPTDTRTRREWSERIIQYVLRGDSVTGVATSVGERPKTRTVSAYDAAGQPVNKYAPFFWYTIVSPEYFRVSRIPIVAGRDFSSGEFAEPQIILDKAAANSMWPGTNPIGKQIKLDSAHTRLPWYRVVGVAEPLREYFQHDQDYAAQQREMRRKAAETRFSGQVYVLNAADTGSIGRLTTPNRSWSGEFFHLSVRGRGDPRRLAMMLGRHLATMGPNVRSGYPQTWEQSTGIARLRARHDFIASLFGVFAMFALGLAALGVYAIIAHMVAQRTREFGVRIAVGAGERDIRELVIGEGRILALLGIAIGLIITYYTAGWVRAFVFSDWDRYDSRVFFVAVVVLFGATWLASYLPARRAMRINPVEALRND